MTEIGLIGLPNVGKSTVFSLLTKISVPIEKFPFTTIEPNVGVIEVPDGRLDFLSSHLKPKKKTYATIKFVDIAGLVKGASQGEGLGNKFLAHIREVDGIVHILRFFFDNTISSSIGEVNPIEEIKVINLELLFSDEEILKNYVSKLVPKARSGDKIAASRMEFIDLLIRICNETLSIYEVRKFIRSHMNDLKDKELISLLRQLLSNKDVMYLLNYDETIERNAVNEKIYEVENFTGCKCLCLAAKFELSLLDFPEEERKKLRYEYAVNEDEVKNFIQHAVKNLGLITFYTVVGDEFRAWLIKQGSSILDAAGKIHSDMRDGFINAEVCEFDTFKNTPDLRVLHQQGNIKIYGKDYIVKDGDIIKINFR
ncbi:MAG: redox-regulated ATPase YchF [Endomicrobia bacterium]|nr:redox-regulated ATPase YchF [Endomicrobiia bacterium]MCX7940963.1 redox-regulated ATPase YchF [Endomicrobiia bacterium]MDW8055636.1 redox-regulated ATPase YchF [Elusimicrobiota bacterium]